MTNDFDELLIYMSYTSTPLRTSNLLKLTELLRTCD